MIRNLLYAISAYLITYHTRGLMLFNSVVIIVDSWLFPILQMLWRLFTRHKQMQVFIMLVSSAYIAIVYLYHPDYHLYIYVGVRAAGNNDLTQGFEFMNGTKLPQDYQFWCPGFPVLIREQCLMANHYFSSNRWYDAQCYYDEQAYSYACQKDPAPNN